jgi:hypothetical protein
MISRRIPLVVALLCALLAAAPAASAAQHHSTRSAHSKHKRCPHGTKRVRKHGRVRCVRPKPVPAPAAPSAASQTPAASQPTPQSPAAAPASTPPAAESDYHVMAQVWADPSNGSVISPPSSGGGYVACSGGQATLVVWYQHGWVSMNYWSSCGWYMQQWTDWTWWSQGHAQLGGADYPPVMAG